MIDAVNEKFPNVKIVATTLREAHSANHHSWSAVAWIDGEHFQAPTCELNVHDRVGGGDGFAGRIYLWIIMWPGTARSNYVLVGLMVRY